MGTGVLGQALAGAALLLMSSGAAQAETRDRGDPNRTGEGSTFLPFLNVVRADQSRTRPPQLSIIFGDRQITAVMDTGSTGLLLSASAIPGWKQLRSLGPASLTYSSSGRVMEGQWVVTRVVIAGRDGARLQTEPIPVMAVTRIACLKTARNCTPEEQPRGVAMLGVGFSREGDHQAQSTPDRNAFLRTEAEASGKVRRGYVVSRDGVSVGLSGATLDPAFHTIRLNRDERTGDWSAPPVCLSIDDRLPPSCGTVLVDTGVSGSFLTASDEQLTDVVTGSQMRPGTRIGVQLGGERDPPWGYTFQVGDHGPLVPDKVTVVRRRGPAFFNTSVYFLNGFDVLYDADQGVTGYRARH